MVFVVGVRRSGTNWVQRILAAHPDAVAVPTESNLFSKGLTPLQGRFQHGAIGAPAVGRLYMERERFLDAVRDFCDTAFGGLLEVLGPEARHLVERSPMDSEVLDLIGEVYPDATFVHIIRDGRDVVRSLVSQDWGPTSVAEAAGMWRDTVQHARDVGAVLDHYHEVRYEQLLVNPADGVQSLYDATGFDLTATAVAAGVVEASISYNADPRAPQLAEGKWRGSFSADDLAAFMEAAGSTLVELGYDTDASSLAATPAPRSRSLAAAVRGRVRRGRAPSMTKNAFAAERLTQLRAASAVLDTVLADLAARRFDALADRLGGPAPVRIVTAGQEWRGRGDEGRARLVAELTSDAALFGRQVRGDVYAALPLHTLVATYRTDDGRSHERVLVLGIEGDALTTVTWYRLDARDAR